MNNHFVTVGLIVFITLVGCKSNTETIMETKISKVNNSIAVTTPYKSIKKEKNSSAKNNNEKALFLDSESIADSKLAENPIVSDEIAIVSLFSRLSEQKQIFYIDTKKDTIITGNKGTILKIGSNSFVTNSGKIVSDIVKFELVEYMDKSEFVYASLSTHTGKGDMLESGGTISLRAYSGKEELLLAKGKTICFEVPANEVKKDMELFSGVRDVHGTMKWYSINKEEGKTKKSYKKSVKKGLSKNRQLLKESTIIRFKNGAELYSKSYTNKRVGSIPQKENLDTISIYLEIDENNIIKKCTSRSTKYKRSSKPNIYYFSTLYDKKFKEGSKINLSKSLTVFSGFKNYIVDFADIETFHLKHSYFKLIRKNKNNGKSIEVVMQKIVSISNDTLNNTDRNKQVIETIESKLSSGGESDLDAEEMEYYVFHTAKLGWINVDRFLHLKGPKIKFVLEDKNFENSKVSMVFKNYQSVLPGYLENGKVKFDDIPVGEPFTIVAIKMQNGLPMLYVKDTPTAREKFNEPVEFKQVSFAELKEEVKKINK